MKFDGSRKPEYFWQSDTLVKVYVLREIYPLLQDPVAEAIATFQAAYEAIPTEYRQTAKFEITLYDEPGGPHPELSIFYFRPPNDEELAERARIRASQAENAEKRRMKPIPAAVPEVKKRTA